MDCHVPLCIFHSLSLMLLQLFGINGMVNISLTFKLRFCSRKRLDATLQDLEEKQNSKKEAVSLLPVLFICSFCFLNNILRWKQKSSKIPISWVVDLVANSCYINLYCCKIDFKNLLFLSL